MKAAGCGVTRGYSPDGLFVKRAAWRRARKGAYGGQAAEAGSAPAGEAAHRRVLVARVGAPPSGAVGHTPTPVGVVCAGLGVDERRPVVASHGAGAEGGSSEV